MEPTAEKILSVLVGLYAKQEGVRIGYIVESVNNKHTDGGTQNDG